MRFEIAQRRTIIIWKILSFRWADARVPRTYAALAGTARQTAYEKLDVPGAVGARTISWTRSRKCQTTVGDDPNARQIPSQLRGAAEIGPSRASSLLMHLAHYWTNYLINWYIALSFYSCITPWPFSVFVVWRPSSCFRCKMRKENKKTAKRTSFCSKTLTGNFLSVIIIPHYLLLIRLTCENKLFNIIQLIVSVISVNCHRYCKVQCHE